MYLKPLLLFLSLLLFSLKPWNPVQTTTRNHSPTVKGWTFFRNPVCRNMRFLLHRPLHKLSALSSSTSLLMASKQLLKSTPFTNPSPPSPQTHLFHSHRLVFSAFPPKPTSKARPFCLRTNGYSYASRATVKAPKPGLAPLRILYFKLHKVCLTQCFEYCLIVFCEFNVVDLEITDEQRCESLTKKLKEIGIDDEICEPAQYGHLICPMVCYLVLFLCLYASSYQLFFWSVVSFGSQNVSLWYIKDVLYKYCCDQWCWYE